jgi:hypothetical protein
MRLSGQAKLGYFPTPETQLPLIASWLKLFDEQSNLVRTLDPCSGQGEALAYLAERLGRNITTYGIELSPQRASEAEQRLDYVLNTGFENAALTEETFSMVLLNPPYDGSEMTGGGERMEYTFLTSSTKLLVRGGVLVYIIPEPRVSEKIARHLTGWYKDLRCFRFTGEDYAAFRQIIIFGVRRLVYQQPTNAEVEEVTSWSRGQVLTGYQEGADETGKLVNMPVFTALPEIFHGKGEYQVPPSPPRGSHGAAFSFKFSPVTVDDFLRAGEKAVLALERSPAWLDLIPQTEPLTITPAITPKLGHVSMQVSGGLLGTNLVTAPDGREILIKGGTEKFNVRVDDENEDAVQEYDPDDPDQRKRLFRVRVEERSRPILSTLDGAGNLVFLNQPDAIRDVLREHVSRLARQLEARNVPRYDRKPQDWEWQVFSPLSPDRQLPGRRETGLTVPQKHFSIALGRLLLAQGAGMINGEMASGKTTMALAVAEYLKAAHERRSSNTGIYPVLVVGPGIVTGDDNWPREVREVIPGATSRVIEVTARPVPKPARVKDWVRSLDIVLEDDSFEGLSAKRTWLGVVEAAQKQDVPLTKEQRFALWDTLKKAEQDPPPCRQGSEKPNLLDARIGGYRWLGLGDPSEGSGQGLARDPEHARECQKRYSLVQFLQEYRSGVLPEKSFAILSYETAKLAAGRVPAMPIRRMRVRVLVDGKVQLKIVHFCTCPQCGKVVSEEYDEQGEPLLASAITAGKSAEQFVGSKRRFCQSPTPRRAWNPEKGRHEMRTHDEDGRMYVCGAPLFAYASLRREAAARYIQRKAKKAFPLLVVDEIHDAKAKGTGNGWALAVLTNSARYTLGLTGTLFGGYSTDIYWLMYRLSGIVRREFGFHDEGRWVQKVGLRRFTFYVTNPENVQEDGSYTGRQYLNRVDEKPGILPAIIRYGLPNIVFASLQDMDLPLPPYSEEMAWLELTEAMQAQYDLADGSAFESPLPGSLYSWAIEEMKEGTRGALSVWLNTALNRPDAMFRDETVIFNRRISGKGKYAIRKEEEVMELPAVELVSPKDLWLAERCLAERRSGRKSLIFIRQTGKRDVQPHVAEVLQEHGLRVGVLSPSISPRSRVAWIQKHEPHLDVLLTNARLVKVGLNLRMFNTAIFYEIEWSLAILWQAMRRVYRPGAPLPVRVIFPAYAGTLEERALSLLGQKMKAASLFYGDEVASALTEEDESDFLNDLVRSVLKKEQFSRTESIFATENDLSASPLGSPTALSPQAAVVMTLQEWMVQKGIDRKNGGKRRRGGVPNGQLVLPF